MTLHDPAFAKRLRARVRPQWKAAIKKHGPVGPSAWSRRRNIGAGGCFFLAAMAVSAWLLKVRALEWSPRAVAAYLGVAFSLLAVMISGMVRLKISRPKELLTLLWWPASDELIGHWGWQALRRFRRGVFFSLLFLLGGLALVMGEAASWPSFLALLLTATLGTLAAAGVVVLPISGRGIIAAGALLAALVVMVIAPPSLMMLNLGAWLDQKADVLAWLHPGGWLVGFFRAALHPQGWRHEWLLIGPLLALAESTRYWGLRHCASVDSAALLELWQSSPVAPADAESPDETEDAAPTPDGAGESGERGEEAPETTAPEVPVLREQWRALVKPPAAEGRFQQWQRARLTPRERLLCEALGLAPAPWQRIVGWGWKFAAVVWGLAWLGRELHWTSGGLMMILIGLLLVTTMRMVAYAAAPGAGLVSVWMPIGYAEIRRLEWKRWWPIVALSTPWLVLATCAAGWLQDFPLGPSALAGLKLSLLNAALHPWFTICKYSAGSGDTVGKTWSSARILANIVLAILGLLAGLAGIMVPGWLGWLLIAVAAALTWRFYAVHRRQWDRRKFDVGPGAAG